MRVAAADLDLASAKQTAELIASDSGSSARGRSLGVQVDVGDSDSVAAMVAATERELGPLSVLVNCAGVISVGLLTELAEGEWDRVIEVNLKGPFLCTKAVLPGMVERGWGRIVNIASDGAKTAEAYLSHYCASKFGLLGLTQSAALECAGSGVTVNSICPVIADTPMREQLIEEYAARPEVGSRQEAARLFRSEIPMGREVRPEEIAAVASFLVGEEAEFITGEAINVSGGHEFH